MNNQIKVFESFNFGKIRTTTINNDIWFVGKDVATALGYSNTADAIRKHVDEDDKGVAKCDTLGGTQNLSVINESGLYSLVLSSKLPSAKGFKHWITKEVIPSIRKTGGYIAGQEKMSDSELMAKAILVAHRQIEEKNKQIEVMTPKALFADSVSASDSTILIGDLAKILKGNGIDIGTNRLFERLRNEGYLIKRVGESYNSPTQRAMELGLFKIKETVITHADGHTTISKTTKVTGKGQQYFVNKYLGVNNEIGSN